MRHFITALLLAAYVAAVQAQLPPLPASCKTLTSITQLLGSEAEINANCPPGAASCAEACKTTLQKVGGRARRSHRRKLTACLPACALRPPLTPLPPNCPPCCSTAWTA